MPIDEKITLDKLDFVKAGDKLRFSPPPEVIPFIEAEIDLSGLTPGEEVYSVRMIEYLLDSDGVVRPRIGFEEIDDYPTDDYPPTCFELVEKSKRKINIEKCPFNIGDIVKFMIDQLTFNRYTVFGKEGWVIGNNYRVIGISGSIYLREKCHFFSDYDVSYTIYIEGKSLSLLPQWLQLVRENEREFPREESPFNFLDKVTFTPKIDVLKWDERYHHKYPFIPGEIYSVTVVEKHGKKQLEIMLEGHESLVSPLTPLGNDLNYVTADEDMRIYPGRWFEKA